jgi:hypothetical protein
MNLKCLFGKHDWTSDCEKCARCGLARPNAHTWTGCKCTTCRVTRDEWHEWSEDWQACRQCGTPSTFASVKSADVPRIQSILDKIAAHSRCIETSGWSRLQGDYKSPDDQAKSHVIDLGKLLTPQDLGLAEEVGLGHNMLTRAAQAFCFHTSNNQVGQDTWRDEISTVAGDDAIEALCRIKSLLSSYVLYRVAAAKPITITLSACIGTEERTLDFGARASRAGEELMKRGFGKRDPLSAVTATAKVARREP